MDIKQIITKKRDHQSLTKQEIEYFVTNYTNGTITDYQVAALTMAIYLNGMNEEETVYLTLAMANSGDILDLSELGTVVDKHSTGGIGDKVSLILVPIISSLGIPVAKMSGRGLGYTGGTIDKLETIPGYQTNLTTKEFMENVKKVGACLIGQTLNLAPADKKLYSLRDAICTTESIPLISSSIMSKKIAAGASKIVLEVTCGSGAFMKDRKQATTLAQMMQKIGKMTNKQTICVITNMEQPLGKAVGNSLEVLEATRFLKGTMQEDVKEVVLALGAYMIKLAGKGEDIEENKRKMLEQVKSGAAFSKYKQWIASQGGDISYLEDPAKWKKASYILPLIAKKTGYVTKLDAEKIGEIAMQLGAGRLKKEDAIKPEVGIVLEKKIGEKVEEGEILAYIHADEETLAQKAKQDLEKVYEMGEKQQETKTVLEILM